MGTYFCSTNEVLKGSECILEFKYSLRYNGLEYWRTQQLYLFIASTSRWIINLGHDKNNSIRPISLVANATVPLAIVFFLCFILNRMLTIIMQVLLAEQFHFPACNGKATVFRWEQEVLYFHSWGCNSYENLQIYSLFVRFLLPLTKRSGPFIHKEFRVFRILLCLDAYFAPHWTFV